MKKKTQTFDQFLAVNELDQTEEVLMKISIHAMDEDVDPPKLTPKHITHLLRLINFIKDLRK